MLCHSHEHSFQTFLDDSTPGSPVKKAASVLKFFHEINVKFDQIPKEQIGDAVTACVLCHKFLVEHSTDRSDISMRECFLQDVVVKLLKKVCSTLYLFKVYFHFSKIAKS